MMQGVHDVNGIFNSSQHNKDYKGSQRSSVSTLRSKTTIYPLNQNQRRIDGVDGELFPEI